MEGFHPDLWNAPTDLGGFSHTFTERGKGNRKDRTLTQTALHRDRPAHLLQCVLYNGEPEAGAASGPRPCLINTVKAFEDPGQIARGDAEPGVANLYHGRATLARDLDAHFAIGPIELHGVFQQVDPNLFQADFVGQNADIVELVA